MDFTQLMAAIAKLSTDVGKEVADAKAAILAAQGGDPTALAAALAAVQNIDDAINAADAAFQPVVTTNTTT